MVFISVFIHMEIHEQVVTGAILLVLNLKCPFTPGFN